MAVTFEEISPEIAANYLEKNFEKNRRLSSHRAETLAAEIRRGEWIVNGATIAFNVEGFLVDGQHRLLACIKAGRPIASLVVRNVPMKSFYTIDTGRVRTAADILHIAGEKNAMTLACTARYVSSWQAKATLGSLWRQRVSAQTLQAILRKHPGIRDAIGYIGGTYQKADLIPKIGASLYTAFYYLVSQINEKEAQAFFEGLMTGVELNRGHPVLALRNQLIANSRSGARFEPEHIGRLFVKAWNLFCKGERVPNSTGLTASKDELLETLEAPPLNKGYKARFGIQGP